MRGSLGSPPRVVVGGYLGLLPAGGVTWDYVQYPVGFAELGCDVFYIEDTRLWPVYQTGDEGGADCSPNVEHLSAVMDAFGLEDRWAYRDEASGRCFGLSQSEVAEVCASADVFVNVSCSTFLRDEYLAIPVRALIDSDPMFTQIQYETEAMFTEGEPALRSLVHEHTHHFTFGESVGETECRIPISGIEWMPTRQPISLDRWTPSPPPSDPEAPFTTVMNWSAGRPLEYDGETWGQKNIEFRRFLHVPEAVPDARFAVAVGRTMGDPFPAEEAEAAGWRVLDPEEWVPEWRSYGRFISDSLGEFSIAKQTYVKGRTGWFSCRSACYLAAGRPVVTQDTGWSRHYPTGEGLFAFDDEQDAVAGVREIAADRVRHSRAAREIAEECFDSRRVLSDLLDRC